MKLVRRLALALGAVPALALLFAGWAVRSLPAAQLGEP